MFEEAIEKSKGKSHGGGKCWYPYSYLIGYLLRRARFLVNGHSGSASKAFGIRL